VRVVTVLHAMLMLLPPHHFLVDVVITTTAGQLLREFSKKSMQTIQNDIMVDFVILVASKGTTIKCTARHPFSWNYNCMSDHSYLLFC